MPLQWAKHGRPPACSCSVQEYNLIPQVLSIYVSRKTMLVWYEDEDAGQMPSLKQESEGSESLGPAHKETAGA